MESLIGTTIGGYKLTDELGTGPTGQLFSAINDEDSIVLVKVLHPLLNLYDKVQAYWSDLQKIRDLAHPHMTLPTKADWSISGRFYLVMERLPGISLHDALSKHGKLSVQQVLLFMGQACSALEAIHELGLFHGAVKPTNIILVPKGNQQDHISTKLTDFASTQLIDTSKNPLEAPGMPGVPIPEYLAPEQFERIGNQACDIYALGVVLYESLSGRRPFVGSYEELSQIAGGEVVIPKTIPHGLAKVVLKALSKAPVDRYLSVEEMREALEQWASSNPAELNDIPVSLFTKKNEDVGVGKKGGFDDTTVRVSMDQISAVFEKSKDEEKEQTKLIMEVNPLSSKDSDQQQPLDSGKNGITKDNELAALTEAASSPLKKDKQVSRSKRKRGSVVKNADVVEMEGYFDEDGELVELPLERSVRAFVAKISPKVQITEQTHPTRGGNGESLDLALDAFVNEARKVCAKLPSPTIDDAALAALAKIPMAEPELAKPEPLLPFVTPEPIAPQAEPRSMFFPIVIGILFGGAIVFGAMKFLGKKPEPTQAMEIENSPASPSKPVITSSKKLKAISPIVTPLESPKEAPSATPPAGEARGSNATQQETTTSDTLTTGTKPEPTAEPKTKPQAITKTPPTIKRKAKKTKAEPKKQKRASNPIASPIKQRKQPTKSQKTKPATKKEEPKSDWVDPFAQ